MKVYVAPEVAEVEALHPYLRDDSFRTSPIREQILRQAIVLKEAHALGDRRVRMHLMSWWPGAKGRTLDEVMDARLSQQDAELTIAREYGYANWSEVDDLKNATPDNDFEKALDDLLAGETERLQLRLEENPNLTIERSAFGHRATLLHYLGANGVESHRQRTPLNAAVLAELLIGCGADIHAEAIMYGGGQTAYALASSSAHPHKAGISAELNRALGG